MRGNVTYVISKVKTNVPRDVTAFIAVVRALERRAVLKRARPNRFSLVPLPTIELHVRLLEHLAATGNYFAQFLPMNGSVSYSQSAVSGLVYARGFTQAVLSLVR